MKSNKVNYVVVGTFVLAMLVGCIAAIAILSGRAGERDRYYTTYNDVSDLKFGTKVLYMGYPVGQIEAIEPIWTENGQVQFDLALGITEEWRGRIPSDSVAEIKAAGLLAAVVIDIRAGESDVALGVGERLVGLERVNIFAAMTQTANTIRDLTEKDVKPLIRHITTYVDAFGAALETDGTQMVRDLSSFANTLSTNGPEIIENVAVLSRELDATARRLQALLGPQNIDKVGLVLDNAVTASSNVSALTSDEKLQSTLHNIELASQHLNSLTANANRRLDDVIGEETVHKVRSTLDNVANAARNVAQLSKDLRTTRDKLEHFITVLDRVATDNQPDVRHSVKDLRHTMESISNRIDTMTYNLEGTSRNMYEFSRQLRQNPGLLLGGRAPADAASQP